MVLGIEFDGNGAQWDISNTITLAPGVVTDIPAIPPENGVSFTWLELKQGEVFLHQFNGIPDSWVLAIIQLIIRVSWCVKIFAMLNHHHVG